MSPEKLFELKLMNRLLLSPGGMWSFDIIVPVHPQAALISEMMSVSDPVFFNVKSLWTVAPVYTSPKSNFVPPGSCNRGWQRRTELKNHRSIAMPAIVPRGIIPVLHRDGSLPAPERKMRDRSVFLRKPELFLIDPGVVVDAELRVDG